VTPLSVFGLFAVTAMLLCYALEHRSVWFSWHLPSRVAKLRLRLLAGRVAVWTCRSGLGRRRNMTMVVRPHQPRRDDNRFVRVALAVARLFLSDVTEAPFDHSRMARFDVV
jgi:hypothetical protein